MRGGRDQHPVVDDGAVVERPDFAQLERTDDLQLPSILAGDPVERRIAIALVTLVVGEPMPGISVRFVQFRLGGTVRARLSDGNNRRCGGHRSSGALRTLGGRYGLVQSANLEGSIAGGVTVRLQDIAQHTKGLLFSERTGRAQGHLSVGHFPKICERLALPFQQEGRPLEGWTCATFQFLAVTRRAGRAIVSSARVCLACAIPPGSLRRSVNRVD